MTSPTSVPVHLLALEQAAQSAAVGGSAAGVTSDSQLRAAVVNVARYYLRLAETRTPAQMEALIWDKTSADNADHGPSCAAFASLTLELAAQAVGQQSWVSGGASYPWPLHTWADVRVDTNPASPAITSQVADAEGHGRWHAVGSGYQPQAGDWVVFEGHVEVVTSYAGGVLHTIGADSAPDLNVNAHSFGGALADYGVAGFVDNGHLAPAGTTAAAGTAAAGSTTIPASSGLAGGAPADGKARPGKPGAGTPAAGKPGSRRTSPGHSPAAARSGAAGASFGAAVPGVLGPGGLTGQPAKGGNPSGPSGTGSPGSAPGASLTATVPGVLDAAAGLPAAGSALVPGELAQGGAGTSDGSGSAATPAKPHGPTSPAAKPSAGTSATASSAPGKAAPAAASSASASGRQQQAFINAIAPGALAAQQRYGVPAAVTIAQAIEESAWGSSELSATYHNLFGIKGTGPAGAVSLPTSEFLNGQWVTVNADFRVYHDTSESIADHAELLATSGYYTRAMADTALPDAFAHDLTGVYATDPEYGANLISLMRLYNLYRFDASAAASASTPAGSGTSASVTLPAAAPASAGSAGSHSSAGSPSSRGAAGSAAAAPQAGRSAGGSSASSPSPDPSATRAASPAGGHGGSRAEVPGVGTPALHPQAPTVTPPTRTSGAGGSGRGGSASRGSGSSFDSGGNGGGRGRSGSGSTGRSGTGSGGTGSTGRGGSGDGRTGGSGTGRIPGVFAPGGTGTQAAASTTASTMAYRTPARPAASQQPPARHPGASRAATPPYGTRTMAAYTAGFTAPGFTTPGPARPAAPRTAILRPGATPPAAAPRYQVQLPAAVTTAFFSSAKAPLARGEQLYRDVAACTGVSWELLAAVDWLECKADPRRSPVHGEKLGAVNFDGTSYATKSNALTQVARDLAELAAAVYGVELIGRRRHSVRALAAAFAAFRWGGILRRHEVSAMEFPYSVAGLTAGHQKMHWPDIDAPGAPDRPGARFREPFGALPVLLCLGYPATV